MIEACPSQARIVFPLDQDAFEATLKQVPNSPMGAIDVLCIDPVQLPHPFGEIGIWGLNQPVGWAWDITNFVFWVGIGHAGTLMAGSRSDDGRGADIVVRDMRDLVPVVEHFKSVCGSGTKEEGPVKFPRALLDGLIDKYWVDEARVVA